jgi:hypothetical protein
LAEEIVALTASSIDDPAAVSTADRFTSALHDLGFDPVRDRGERGSSPLLPAKAGRIISLVKEISYSRERRDP